MSSKNQNSGGDGGVSRSWVAGIVMSTIIGWVVSGAESVQIALTGVVLDVETAIFGALGPAGESVRSSFSSAALSVLNVQSNLTGQINEIAGSAGFAGPIIAVILFAVAVASTLAAIRAVLWGLKWIT